MGASRGNVRGRPEPKVKGRAKQMTDYVMAVVRQATYPEIARAKEKRKEGNDEGFVLQWERVMEDQLAATAQ